MGGGAVDDILEGKPDMFWLESVKTCCVKTRELEVP